MECYANKTTHNRHIFNQCGKLVKMYSGFLHFGGVLIWPKRIISRP